MTGLTRGRSPLKQWLVDSRGSMKLNELADRLTAAGYRTRDGEPVKEATLRGWEAPAGAEPPSAAVVYLERVFKSSAPLPGVTDLSALIASNYAVAQAITRQADVLSELVSRLDDLAMGQKVLAEEVGSIVDPQKARRRLAAAQSETPREPTPNGSAHGG